MNYRFTAMLMAALLSLCVLGGCKIDVNELAAESSSENESSSPFYSAPDTDTADDNETDTDVDVTVSESPETMSSDVSSQPMLDTSAYKTMYVTGAADIEIIEDAKDGSRVVGNISCGDSVSFINSVVTEYSFVYAEQLNAFGYIKDINLTDDYSETCTGEVYYVSSDSAPVYATQSAEAIVANLSKNDMVTVIAKLVSGNWRITDKSGSIGYISAAMLSEEKIVPKTVSSKSSSKSSSKTSSKSSSKKENKTVSKAESVYESKTESKSESQVESTVESIAEDLPYVGVGEAPASSYQIYTVDVDLGYLALRGKPDSSTDNVIGELYYEEQVYVIDTEGEFWYVYAPTLGMYGFVKGDYNYLYPSY